MGQQLEQVIHVLREVLSLSEDVRVDADTVLMGGGLSIDSVVLVDFVMALEAAFDIQVDDEEMKPERFLTVGTAEALIASKLDSADRGQ